MIKQETIEQVRASTDIVDLVGGYVPLKKVGRNWRGLCPFHSDRSPSFYVNPERQTYHCFGCGVGGSAINFVMALEKLEFPEAVKFLGKRLGIAIETEQVSGRNQPLYDACEQAAQFYEQQLARSDAGQSYIKKRGLGADTVKRFRLGYAPTGSQLRGYAKRKGLSEDVMLQAGLLARRESGLSDYFYGRFMCPIFSLSGKVIAFGGRVLDASEPKYLNSPETTLFRKGDSLYGSFQAKGYLRDEVPVLVEGNFDLLSLVDQGVNHVVAPLGTALTPQQAQMLRRYNNRIIICFDGDAAGRKASRRAVETVLVAGIEPQVALLPEGDDPDSYIRRNGKEMMLRALSSGVDFVDFVLAGRPLSTVSEQRAVLAELVVLLRAIADDTTRELYANRIADRFRVDKAVLLRGGANARPVQRPVSLNRAIEEKLVGAAMQDAELARIARDLALAEVLGDTELQSLVRVADARCDEPGFGPGTILDLVEDEALRRRVAQWTFTEQSLPSAAEFRERVLRLRADWLKPRIAAAHQQGDEQLAEQLSVEKNRLLQEVSKERSSRQ